MCDFRIGVCIFFNQKSVEQHLVINSGGKNFSAVVEMEILEFHCCCFCESEKQMCQ